MVSSKINGRSQNVVSFFKRNKKATPKSGLYIQFSGRFLVAGAGFEPTTFGL